MGKNLTTILATILAAGAISGGPLNNKSDDIPKTEIPTSIRKQYKSEPKVLSQQEVYKIVSEAYSNLKREGFNSDVDPDVIKAIISTESSNGKDRMSSKGAVGLMGITPIAYEEVYGSRSGFEFLANDDVKNVMTGILYYSRLKESYLGDFPYPRNRDLVFAAYNAGPTQLRKGRYNIDNMPTETRNYVQKVMKAMVNKETSSREPGA